MKTLIIKLAAPLQSYGNEASFGRRTTNYFPTKSAVLGMIAAAMGYRRDDKRILELNDLSFAVRIDQPGKITTDFQIAEYAKNANKTARKLTYRNYLQDAVFLVGISSEKDDWIDKIKFAVQHPKFQLYLGRRSNPPAGPLEVDTFDDKNPLLVLKDLKWSASDWYKKRHKSSSTNIEIISDVDLVKKDNKSNTFIQIKDKIGSFDQKNIYHNYLEAVSLYVTLKNDLYSRESTDHDIMSFI